MDKTPEPTTEEYFDDEMENQDEWGGEPRKKDKIRKTNVIEYLALLFNLTFYAMFCINNVCFNSKL